MADLPIPMDYPVSIWSKASTVAPGLIDTVSSNMKIILNALGVPVANILYYRMYCTAPSQEASHLFIAVDELDHVVRVPSARLALITSTIDPQQIKVFTASMTSDPLGALLLKANGAVGERINRFPPLFGFKAPRGERHIYDRQPELQALRRDGYFAMTFLPVTGVDHRMQLAMEIASLWGFSLTARDKNWPDLLVLRNDTPNREDFGGVPDETWMNHALSRVLEDHLPVIELDGLWMGSLPRNRTSRARVFYAVLDWIRMRRLPYITARTFHCYVRRDLSAVVTLGSLRDRLELVEWLEMYPFDALRISNAKSELHTTLAIFGSERDVAVRDSTSGDWLVVHAPDVKHRDKPMSPEELTKTLRAYYGKPETCSVPGSPLKGEDIVRMPLEEMLKIVRIAECEAAAAGVCMLDADSKDSWFTSHRAYRAAIRSHTLRTHDTLGIYRIGPRKSPFFSDEVHQYIPLPPESRYRGMVSQVSLALDAGRGEDALLKALVGTVWLFTVQEAATSTTPASEFDVMQVASDRDGEEVRRTLFDAWNSGHMIGTWCRVMLTHRDSLSVSVAGGTVDPLLAHAGDSVVDGNRWLDVTRRAIAACATK